MQQGANLVLHSSDLFLYQQALTRDIARLKAAAGVAMPTPQTGGPVV